MNSVKISLVLLVVFVTSMFYPMGIPIALAGYAATYFGRYVFGYVLCVQITSKPEVRNMGQVFFDRTCVSYGIGSGLLYSVFFGSIILSTTLQNGM